MYKLYFIIITLLLLNNLIVKVVYCEILKVRQPFPGKGTLTITKNGGIEGTHEIVEIDLTTFRDSITNRKILPIDEKSIRNIYNDPIFKLLPSHTNFTLGEDTQFYDYIYYVSIPTPLLSTQEKTIYWNSRTKKPSFFNDLERIIFDYGVILV